MEHHKHGAMPGTPAPKTTTLHEHPHGHVIGYADSHLIVIDDVGLEIHMPIAPHGLVELGLKFMSVGVTVEALAALQLAATQSVGGAH